MEEWRRRIPTGPCLATNGPHYGGETLNMGYTVPLQHPPVLFQHRASTAYSSLSTYAPPNAPSPANTTCHVPLNQNSLLSSLSAAPGTSNRRNSNSRKEKKRWQTANYRWMFTKRKGKFEFLLKFQFFFSLSISSSLTYLTHCNGCKYGYKLGEGLNG